MNWPLIYALLICIASAVLEGILAGKGVKQRFAELRLPRRSPPLWAWIGIGVAYYVVCFAVLYRLFQLPQTGLRQGALALLCGMILANALWNYVFFRARNLLLAWVTCWPYSAVALALFVLLLRLDAAAGWWLLPYIMYLFYANFWGYEIWKLNRPPELGAQ